jgi:hypothetical protein
VAGLDLLIEMKQFLSGILQAETPEHGVEGCEQIEE